VRRPVFWISIFAPQPLEWFTARPILKCAVSKKSAKIAALIENCRHPQFAPHYCGYFECFNAGLFYEAHDVLEELWLAQRNGPNYAFYKGLIQYAGAFVHLQKHSERYPRLKPAAALFRLAQTNLRQYPTLHEGLDLNCVLNTAEEWIAKLGAGNYLENPFIKHAPPKLALVSEPSFTRPETNPDALG
jgi:predicted metal-dependent hydrolase